MKHLRRMLAPVALLLCATTFMAPCRAQTPVEPAPPPASVVAAPSGGHELTAADAQAWLDGLFPYAMKKNDLAAAVVVVVKDGKILVARGYGYADVAAKKPVDPATTLFRPGSISKTFMWTAVMQLVEQGKLDLDTDVNKYLDFTIPPRDGKPITLRDLMTHTPGFEETDKNLFAPDAKQLMSNEAWLKEWVPERVYAPGEVSAYSNYGAALAGYIVQRVSGQPFDDYIEQHIYQPLGMKYATFRQPLPASLEPYMAKSYAKASSPAKPFELVTVAPAGSMSVSGEDMGRYMIAHLQDGRYGEAQILRPETAQQMHNFKHYSVPGLPPIALGFYHLDRNGQDIIGHGGDTELFHSELMLYLKHDVGVFVSIDGAGDGGLRHQLWAGFADRYFPAVPVNQPILATAREHGALLVGRYLNSRVSVSNFMSMLNLLSQPKIAMEKDGTLVTSDFKDLAGQPRRWREVAPFIWRDFDNGGHLGALMKDGKVRWLSVDEVAPVMVFMPVPGWQSASWNLPLLYFAVMVFLLAALLWPIAALVRRACGKPLAPQQPARRWYRWSRVVAILHLLFFGGWVYVLAQMNAEIASMSNGFDGTLRLIQLIGVLAIVGTIAVIANARHAWRATGGWWRKLNSLALVLACFGTIWFAFSLHLLNLHLNY
ncbi:serine hydrolase domain-containing protein [Rhodanobacter sp. Col0626]|uniref:serine hydrolase domain-containing protein n=1 Tax=Rhodanobacter sp. Col0626 TaxID=3415679 RepID=UPI003CEF3CE9